MAKRTVAKVSEAPGKTGRLPAVKAGRKKIKAATIRVATDTSGSVSLPIAEIIAAAESARIAKHAWDGRGKAPIGYTKGIAVAYGELALRLDAADPIAVAMAAVPSSSSAADALNWYRDQFDAAGIPADNAALSRLRRLFTLLFGLGMRESSGKHCEGRDQSADNVQADTAEAGLFQTSFDITRNRPQLRAIFDAYLADTPAGHVDIFQERVTCSAANWQNFGDEDENGFSFQKMTKACPMFAVEMAALGLRSKRSHWGPVTRFEVEVTRDAWELLLEVERLCGLAAGPTPQRAAVALEATSIADIADAFMEEIDVSTVLPINTGLTSAKEPTMVSMLGSPRLPLTTSCQNDRASSLVLDLKETRTMTDLFRLTGITPALDDVQAVLSKAFAAFPDLAKVLSTEGMMCVRFRKPTSGIPSTKISNHSWGTAVDLKIKGFDAPGNTGDTIPRFIAILIPLFNEIGWYSGVAFRDAMHFEVSEERIRTWADDGLLH
jgi:hypothetical protein